jgi:phosphatidylinositol alpha-1,6-mannosyltransferase
LESELPTNVDSESRRLRVLLITTSFPPGIGGISTWAATLARILSRAGHDVTVLTSDRPDQTLIETGVRVVRTPAMLAGKFVKIVPLTLMGLVLCLRSRPNRLILMTWKHEGITGYILKAILRVRYVVVAHGSEVPEHTQAGVGFRIMSGILSGAVRVIVNSDYTQQRLLALRVAADKIAVIHPPAGLDAMPTTLPLQEVQRRYDLSGKRVILTVGRLVRRKGHEEVVRAVAELRERYPNLVYVIAGEGDLRLHLEEVIKQCRIEERVRLLGRVPADLLDALYRLCEVFVLPACQDGSDVEGFGIVFIEAAGHARPVLAGKSGGVAEAVVDGETGLLVEPGNAHDVARKLTQLLDNPHLRRQLGEEGLRRARERFSQDSQLRRLLVALGADGDDATHDSVTRRDPPTKSSPLS